MTLFGSLWPLWVSAWRPLSIPRGSRRASLLRRSCVLSELRTVLYGSCQGAIGGPVALYQQERCRQEALCWAVRGGTNRVSGNGLGISHLQARHPLPAAAPCVAASFSRHRLRK